MKKNTDAKTAEVAEIKKRVTVRQGKKLTIEHDWSRGDALLYYGDKKIYWVELRRQLREKMSWQDKGCIDLVYSTSGDSDTLTINAGIGYNETKIDNNFSAKLDETKIGEMIKKYGCEFDQAEREKELAEREKIEREFIASVKDEELKFNFLDKTVDIENGPWVIKGSLLLCYGAREIFELTLRDGRMKEIDYIAVGINAWEIWNEDYINSHKGELQKLVQKFGVSNAYSI